jgi:hypothetical protein
MSNLAATFGIDPTPREPAILKAAPGSSSTFGFHHGIGPKIIKECPKSKQVQPSP